MSMPLRLLALAAVLNIAAAGAAAAQTVILKGAAPGETVEVVVNTGTPGSGTAAADGVATVAANLPANAAGRQEMDARLYLDACDKVRRVLIVERNLLPSPPEPGCKRTDLAGVYWVRQRSTIVIDVSAAIPDVLLRQGAYDPTAPARRLAPTGLVVFGGGGLAKMSDAAAIACGDVTDCADDGLVGTYTVGAGLWITRWLGVEASYLKPSKLVTEGNGGTFTFSSSLDAHVVNLVAKVGIPAGPVRLFGQGGTTYHEATNVLTQTIGEASQTVETRTDGWSYTWGGGIEAWISNRLALYGEAGRTKIKGNERLAGEIRIEDTLTHYLFGLRFRLF
jgi:hypothetical protein